eukprot:gene19390-21315_t
MARILLAINLILALFALVQADNGRRHTRYEYKFSFKGPHLVNKQGNVPFWKHYGSAIAGDEQVRITPSLKDQKGSIWTKNKNTNEFWEIEVWFKVTGRGRVGGDGLAVWYNEEAGHTGPVFGSSDNWKGMGLFFDSFDNDGEQNNPYVMVMLNDGTKVYNHFGDGFNQQLGGCMRDFRNRPHPVRAKVRYFDGVLTVFYHNGMSTKDDDFELCMRAENVQLPKQGYFGISAATGGLADDHDVLKFSTYSLKQVTEEKKPEKTISEDERKKLTEQYDQYAQQLEKEKETYKSQHPEKFREEDGKFENVYDRDVRLIYEGQSSIHKLVGTLHGKTGELTTQVNNLHNTVAKLQAGGSVGASSGSAVTRQEFTSLLNAQNELKNSIVNLRLAVDNIKPASSNHPKIDEMHQNLQSVMDNVGHLLSKSQMSGGAQQKKHDCPKINCTSTSHFILFIFLQAAIILGYVYYRNHQEQAAKKFY